MNETIAEFRDEVWRQRTGLIHDGYLAQAGLAQHFEVAVGSNLYETLILDHSLTVDFDGLVPINRVFGFDITEDPILGAHETQLRKKATA